MLNGILWIVWCTCYPQGSQATLSLPFCCCLGNGHRPWRMHASHVIYAYQFCNCLHLVGTLRRATRNQLFFEANMAMASVLVVNRSCLPRGWLMSSCSRVGSTRPCLASRMKYHKFWTKGLPPPRVPEEIKMRKRQRREEQSEKLSRWPEVSTKAVSEPRVYASDESTLFILFREACLSMIWRLFPTHSLQSCEGSHSATPLILRHCYVHWRCIPRVHISLLHAFWLLIHPHDNFRFEFFGGSKKMFILRLLSYSEFRSIRLLMVSTTARKGSACARQKPIFHGRYVFLPTARTQAHTRIFACTLAFLLLC